MTILADSGVLLRLLESTDPWHGHSNRAVAALKRGGDILSVATQNLAEFWNVCTRPTTARGGLGLDTTEVTKRLATLEHIFAILSEQPTTYSIWRHFVTTLGIKGKQVHDARLVALMLSHGIDNILTFNTADFTRYPGLTVLDPRAY
jgi:predicted nucleic acid-binding protein